MDRSAPSLDKVKGAQSQHRIQTSYLQTFDAVYVELRIDDTAALPRFHGTRSKLQFHFECDHDENYGQYTHRMIGCLYYGACASAKDKIICFTIWAYQIFCCRRQWLRHPPRYKQYLVPKSQQDVYARGQRHFLRQMSDVRLTIRLRRMACDERIPGTSCMQI
jgi:hypothetical protein